MINQDNIQTAWVFPPGLYGVYECEHHESWGESLSTRVCKYICSRSPTQLEYGKENKWYKKRDIGRGLVARCDPRDRAR